MHLNLLFWVKAIKSINVKTCNSFSCDMSSKCDHVSQSAGQSVYHKQVWSVRGAFKKTKKKQKK